MPAAMSYHVVRTGGYVPINGKPTRVPEMDRKDRRRFRSAYRYGVYCDACGWGKICLPWYVEEDAEKDGYDHVNSAHGELVRSGAMFFNRELAVVYGVENKEESPK